MIDDHMTCIMSSGTRHGDMKVLNHSTAFWPVVNLFFSYKYYLFIFS